MAKRMDETVGVNKGDGLLANSIPVPDVVTVKLTKSKGVVKRGTVISGTPGGSDFVALAAAAEAGKALYVVADDIDTTTDTVATAYRTGHFVRSALLVGSDYTLTAADEEMLRKSGIILSDAY